MIVLRPFDGLRAQDERRKFPARLAAKARRLAEAHAEARLHGERRWRLARLLWPLIAKER